MFYLQYKQSTDCWWLINGSRLSLVLYVTHAYPHHANRLSLSLSLTVDLVYVEQVHTDLELRWTTPPEQTGTGRVPVRQTVRVWLEVWAWVVETLPALASEARVQMQFFPFRMV
jgi:hypothetical protein